MPTRGHQSARPPATAPFLRLVKVRRRCLGPREKEHYFPSAHPGERVCPKCRELQRQMRLSPLRVIPVCASSAPPVID